MNLGTAASSGKKHNAIHRIAVIAELICRRLPLSRVAEPSHERGARLLAQRRQSGLRVTRRRCSAGATATLPLTAAGARAQMHRRGQWPLWDGVARTRAGLVPK